METTISENSQAGNQVGASTPYKIFRPPGKMCWT